MLLVTPQAANKTIGQGGFQEVEQMAVFRDMVGYQEEVRDASRLPEVLNRVICKAKRLSAPAQINIPRDYLDPGDRRGAACAARVRASGRRCSGGGRGGSPPVVGQISGDSFRRGCRAGQMRSANVSRSPSVSTPRYATTTSTTIHFPVVIRSPLARSATTGRVRQWS